MLLYNRFKGVYVERLELHCIHSRRKSLDLETSLIVSSHSDDRRLILLWQSLSVVELPYSSSALQPVHLRHAEICQNKHIAYSMSHRIFDCVEGFLSIQTEIDTRINIDTKLDEEILHCAEAELLIIHNQDPVTVGLVKFVQLSHSIPKFV